MILQVGDLSLQLGDLDLKLVVLAGLPCYLVVAPLNLFFSSLVLGTQLQIALFQALDYRG